MDCLIYVLYYEKTVIAKNTSLNDYYFEVS